MPASDATLILFSGLGADARLFAPQQAEFPSLIVPDWLHPRHDESLTHYVHRWAPHLPLHGQYYLGGVSFGGFVALELARICRPAGVFLIGSCRDAKHINAMYRFGALLASLLPTPVSRGIVTRLGPAGLAWHEALEGEAATLVTRIARTPVMPIIEWGGRVMATWRLNGPIACPVHQLHGALDTAIHPQPALTELLIPGARHLINLTHPQVVNDFIRRQMGSKGR